MNLNIDKDWFLKACEIEANCEIKVGPPLEEVIKFLKLLEEKKKNESVHLPSE